jgi:RND family efflux transporter MFP subunit
MKRLVPALVLAAGMATATCGAPDKADPAADDTFAPLPLARVAESPFAAFVEAGGAVRARTTASVASRVLAPVTDVRVRAGDRVRQGQVLVVLDARESAARAAAATAALRSAEDALRAADAGIDTAAAEQKLAAATFTRVSGLHARRSATAQELDQAASALSAADARLAGARAAASAAAAGRDAARAAAEAAGVTTSYTTLVAPFAGTVAARLVEPGSMATPGTPLVTLEDTAALRLEATLDEARASLVLPGAMVDVQLSANADTWIQARIVELERVDPSSHQFRVKAELPAGTSARTGAFGRMRIPVPARAALSVPATSLVRRGQLSFVFVPDAAGRARLRAVSIGRSGSDRVEVLAGLSAGEPVVEAPPVDLTDGRRVTAAAATSQSPSPLGAPR